MSLAKQPQAIAGRAGALGQELVTIARGHSDRVPVKCDRRFDDPAWRGNPLFKRSMQAYLAATDTVDVLFTDAPCADFRAVHRDGRTTI